VTTTDGSSEAVVWIPGAEGDNHLHAYDGDTGAVIANVAIPLPTVRDASPKIRRYVPPIAAKGRIYVATDNSIAAFSP
jgi:outer membrane protein assembly factor BamB